MDSITELAKMLKERNNPSIPVITIGTVINTLPDIQIQLNDVIILTNEHLVFSAHLLPGYSRNATFDDKTSTIQYNDTIQVGDQVILIPTFDEQTYYVIDKAVKL